MLRLVEKREAFWIECPMGVRLKCRPVTTAVIEAARTSAHRKVRALRKAYDDVVAAGGVVGELPDLSNDAVAVGVGYEALCAELGKMALIEWEGVGNEDGELAPLEPAAIEALMRVEPVADAFYRSIVAAMNKVDAEKKSSAPAPSGSGAAEAPTAETVSP